MKVFSIIGISGSGKTTTLEHLLREFGRRNFSVASIKDIHYENFAMDTPGTNTYRHRQAGADMVTGRGCNETAIIFPRQLPMRQILSFYHHDIVLIEGDQELNVPQILCAKNLQEAHELKDERTLAVAGLISSQEPPVKLPWSIPLLDARKETEKLVDLILERTPRLLPDFPPDCCTACGRSCRELLLDIMKGQGHSSECILWNGQVQVSMGEEDLPMVPFVQDSLKSIITAYLANLEGYRPHTPITIKITPGP